MKNFILLFALVVMASTVFAQSLFPDEIRNEIHIVCGKDFKEYCPNIESDQEMKNCIKQNASNYSDQCTEYLVELRLITKDPIR